MTTSSSSSSSLETLTLVGRLRGTRGLPVFVLLVLGALAIFGRQLLFVRAERSAPDLGFLASPSASGQALLDGPVSRSPVRKGDALVSVNGTAVDFDAWQALRPHLEPGPLNLVVVRDGQELTLRTEAGPPSLAYLLALALRLVTGAVLFLIAVGSFLMRPGGLVAWLFMLVMLGAGVLAMVTGGNAGFLASSYLVILLALALVPGTGLHLFLHFPEPLDFAARRPRFGLALHGVGVFLAAWAVGQYARTGMTVGAPGQMTLGLELAVRAWSILCVLAVVAVVLLSWRRHARAGHHRVVSQYRLLALGVGVGLGVPAVLTALARALQLGPLFGQYATAGILIFALCMGAVLVRHNPLEVDRYAASVVGYVLAVGLLGGTFGLALVALPLVAKRLGAANSSEALVVLTAITFLGLGPLYRRLRRVVDRWFSREQANALQTAEALRRVVDAVQQQPREQALEVVLDSAQVLGGEQVALWQVDASGRNFYRMLWRGGPDEPLPVPRKGPFGLALERAAGVAGLSPASSDPALQQALWEQGLAMTAPVRAHSVPVAVLGVGRRASGFGYRAEDLSFLETLAAQAGLALERGQVVTQIGRYRVERRLASGGMAEVFVAWQLGPGGFERKVALKRLLPELAEDPRYAAGLLDEARIAARLHHRNIAQTYEVGLEAGQHFIAMEYVDGPPLRALMAAALRRGEVVPLPVALAVARSLLQALHHAHEVKDAVGQPMGVVHRDVTPSNVLVSTTGEPKLVDFGLVLANSRLFRTQTGVTRGTLPYMSPEQSTGAPVDRRSDVFSAAATLYELFTGVRAYPEGPLGSKPLPASGARPGLPHGLDAVLARALAADPDARYPTAAAFCEELLAVAEVPPADEAEVAACVKRLSAAAAAEAPEAAPGESHTATMDRPPAP